ncbi:hypothetical protein DRN58_07470, partial [Thermococci archaeon]
IVADCVVNNYSEETAKFTGEKGILNQEEGQIEVTTSNINPGTTYTIIVTAAGVSTTEKYTAI